MNNETVNPKTEESFEISILGRRYIITTDQGAAYVKKAVDYVDKMYQLVKETPGFTRHSKDYQNLMMYLNMADEYLQACQWTEEKQLLVNQEAEERIQSLIAELESVKNQSMETEQRLQDDMIHLKKKVEYSFHEKNRMVEQVKASEQKLIALDKELSGYKTETSVLRRKMDEMTKNAEEVLRLKKENASKTRDWEAKLGQLKSELEEKHAAELEAMEVVHKKNVESMNYQKDKSLQSLREEYEKRLIRMQENHENQLARMKTAHDAKIERILNEKDHATAPLEATISKQNEELIELRDQLAESEKKLASMRYKLQEVAGE